MYIRHSIIKTPNWKYTYFVPSYTSMLIYYNSCFKLRLKYQCFSSKRKYIYWMLKEYSRVAEMVFRFHKGGCICKADVNHSMIQFRNNPDTRHNNAEPKGYNNLKGLRLVLCEFYSYSKHKWKRSLLKAWTIFDPCHHCVFTVL